MNAILFLALAALGPPERPPLDVCLAINRSASMMGEKMATARSAALATLGRLRPSDIVSVVAYDDVVEVLVPATRASDRERLEAAVRAVQPVGGAALFAGVVKCAAELRKDRDARRIRRVVLFAHGEASVGPGTPVELGGLGAQLGEEKIAVVAVGLGRDHERALRALAARSDGGHVFIERADELAGLLDDELLPVVAPEPAIARGRRIVIHHAGDLRRGASPTGALSSGLIRRGASPTGALSSGLIRRGASPTGALSSGLIRRGASPTGARGAATSPARSAGEEGSRREPGGGRTPPVMPLPAKGRAPALPRDILEELRIHVTNDPLDGLVSDDKRGLDPVRLRLRLLFGLLVLAPVAVLALLGVWVARSEEQRAQNEVRALLERKLEDLAVTLDDVAASLEGELLAATERLPADGSALGASIRQHPRLRRLLLVDGTGRVRFPAIGASDEEQRLVRDTSFLWEANGPLGHLPMASASGEVPTHGWQPLPDGEGLGLLFWRRRADGGMAAVSLPSAAIQAALVARLPVTVPDRATGDERMALFDPTGRLVYQWGAYAPPPGSKPLVAIWLRPPFGAWRLAYLGPAPARGHATLGIAGGLVALALVVVGAGLWIYRESTRELRLAAQRVSFVNQVSHELKTPLTNVRLYAELLEEHVDDPVGRQRLEVVVAESQRLGRLITNILTFSRAGADMGAPPLQPAPGCVDDVVRGLLEQFAPGFQTSGVVARFDAGASGRVRVDVDALTQILGNLLGNVEKYAPRGAVVVRTAAAPPITRITVEDEGPGIPAAQRERVFEPFVRLGSPTHEGVPGTGIGLGIARDLARRHGGELRALPAERGARFEVILYTEEVA